MYSYLMSPILTMHSIIFTFCFSQCPLAFLTSLYTYTAIMSKKMMTPSFYKGQGQVSHTENQQSIQNQHDG